MQKNEISTTTLALFIFTGKGGVGKTTLAAVEIEFANRVFAVHLTTSDPAGH